MALQVAILGMNKIGASIGLALSKYPDSLTCVGYDQEVSNARAAAKIGAIGKSYLALHRCVKNTSVIILACPLDDIRENLEIIADHAPSGAAVIDTSPVKSKVSEWAREILPESMHFTGWTLGTNPDYMHDHQLGVEAARGDLFKDSMIGINDSPGIPEKALKLNSDLVTLLGAKAIFIDAAEADGLSAMGKELPRVTALALLLATVDSPGWQEARKLAGSDFANGSLPVLSVGEREELGLSMLLNRENIIRLIDDFMRSMGRIRDYLEENNSEELGKDLEHAINQRLLWLEQGRLKAWDSSDRGELPRAKRPSLLGEWLGSKGKKGKDT